MVRLLIILNLLSSLTGDALSGRGCRAGETFQEERPSRYDRGRSS